jgi:hypothetical protein
MLSGTSCRIQEQQNIIAQAWFKLGLILAMRHLLQRATICSPLKARIFEAVIFFLFQGFVYSHVFFGKVDSLGVHVLVHRLHLVFR